MTDGLQGDVHHDIALPALESRRRQETLEILATASAVLGRSLDLRETADAIARAVIPRLADWAVVDAYDEKERLTRLALAHADPVLQAAADGFNRLWPSDFSPRSATRRVLDTGAPLFLDAGDERLAPLADEAEHFAEGSGLTVRSGLAVPLEANGERLGVLTCFASEGGRLYTAEDLPVAQALAERGAMALLNARRFGRERLARAAAEAARMLAERLHVVVSALAGVRTVEEIAEVITTEARDAFGASVAGLGLLTDEGSTFTMRRLGGLDDATREQWRVFPNLPTLPYGAAVAERSPLFFSSAAAYAARFPHLEAMRTELGLEGAVLLPLFGGNGTALGVLNFAFSAPRAFSEASRKSFVLVAEQCTAALQRVGVQETERDHAEAQQHAQRRESERALAATQVARREAETAHGVAEAASRSKDELLAFVSHELRAPLAPARALALALARSGTLAQEDRETVEEIEYHIAVEARLVENLLDYQRAGRGLLSVRCGRCELREVARRALRSTNRAFRDKAMSVEVAYGTDDSVAWADSLRVQEIIHNMLTNAVKFSPERSTVAVHLRNPAPGWVELMVTDQGSGISPEDLPRLFAPFTQLAEPRGPRSGLGLGLALSRRLAELQGGTLTAASEGRGHGSTFALRLRTASAVPAALLEPDIEFGDTTPDLAGEKGRSLRILVIEDDRSTAVALQRLLRTYGHVVHVAEGLDRAEEIICEGELDIVLSDLQLIGETGLDAPRRLASAATRCGRPPVPAVVLSAYASETDVEEARAAGFVEHLAKPIDEQSLLRALRHASAASP
jgi:signal transduction histidine kinase/ActR/RegA family two-component response regulator